MTGARFGLREVRSYLARGRESQRDRLLRHGRWHGSLLPATFEAAPSPELSVVDEALMILKLLRRPIASPADAAPIICHSEDGGSLNLSSRSCFVYDGFRGDR